jgi:alkanesulfonate monooxygenase SsuD/methylene tetrahydromethanopterin reductase-like flavin-dependent oxidoreductase (luciferase family)
MTRCACTSASRRWTRCRGRAEVILGRGSFIESFPLFGYDLRDYEVLFEEKLDLFSQLLTRSL